MPALSKPPIPPSPRLPDVLDYVLILSLITIVILFLYTIGCTLRSELRRRQNLNGSTRLNHTRENACHSQCPHGRRRNRKNAKNAKRKLHYHMKHMNDPLYRLLQHRAYEWLPDRLVAPPPSPNSEGIRHLCR
ncbi:hypothetical protein L596_000442 [Steinernema carpocapsae]|uniref:Uncharacterized protein n=1 Tax=Steinernema carpocapsae TaxID=34508 RepID=A0A4U8UKI9_STECR|nr:hypothetical protein L596_000442 [Steinernema carpocapsae]